MKSTLSFVLGLSLAVLSGAELLRDVVARRSVVVPPVVVGQCTSGVPQPVANSACFGADCPSSDCAYIAGSNPPYCQSQDDYWFADQYVCVSNPGSWCSLSGYGNCYNYSHCTPMYGTSGGCALPQMQPYCNYCYPSNCDCTNTLYCGYDDCSNDQSG